MKKFVGGKKIADKSERSIELKELVAALEAFQNNIIL